MIVHVTAVTVNHTMTCQIRDQSQNVFLTQDANEHFNINVPCVRLAGLWLAT